MPNYSVILIQFLCRKLYHLLSAMRIRFTAFFSLPCAISISRSPAFFCRIAFARSAASRARATSISSAHSQVRASTTVCSAETSTKPPETAATRRSPFRMMVRPPTPSAATRPICKFCWTTPSTGFWSWTPGESSSRATTWPVRSWSRSGRSWWDSLFPR